MTKSPIDKIHNSHHMYYETEDLALINFYKSKLKEISSNINDLNSRLSKAQKNKDLLLNNKEFMNLVNKHPEEFL